MAVSKCLTTGIPADCDRSAPGGINEVRIAKRIDVASGGLVRDVDDHITAITMESSMVFYLIDFLNENAEVKQTFSNPNSNFSNVQTLELVIAAPDDTIRQRIEELFMCNCGLIVGYQDNNDVWWIMGGRDYKKWGIAYATGGEQTTGKALADANTVTITITCNAARSIVMSDVEPPLV